MSIPRPGTASETQPSTTTANSSSPFIPKIKVPGLVIHAADDPFIPVEPFAAVRFPSQLALELNRFGRASRIPESTI